MKHDVQVIRPINSKASSSINSPADAAFLSQILKGNPRQILIFFSKPPLMLLFVSKQVFFFPLIFPFQFLLLNSESHFKLEACDDIISFTPLQQKSE